MRRNRNGLFLYFCFLIALILKRSSLFILAVMTLPIGIAAQTADCEDLLVASFGADKYNSLIEQNPSEVHFHCFKQTNGYYITDIPPGKTADSFPDLLSLESVNGEVFPDLTQEVIDSGVFLSGYGIEVKPKHYNYFSIGDSNQLFVVYPQELIRTLFEQQ